MKKIINFLIVLIMIFLFTYVTFASDGIFDQTESKALVDGELIEFKEYAINDNNYSKLRNLTLKSNMDGGYNSTRKAIAFDTSAGYIVPTTEMPLGTSVTATLSSTKVSLNHAKTSIKIYNISGREYVSISDVYIAFARKERESLQYKNFEDTYFEKDSDMIHISRFSKASAPSATKTVLKYTGKVLHRGDDITYNLVGYIIDKALYYPLDAIMELINCGLIIDNTTGDINLETNKEYEPPFAQIHQGNVEFMELQKQLYDAYLNMKGRPSDDEYLTDFGNITVPDGATLYIPHGITIGLGGGSKLYVGNNSTVFCNGEIKVSYIDQQIKPVSKSTKNAVLKILTPRFLGLSGRGQGHIILDNKDFSYAGIDIPLISANISYATDEDGLDEIFIDFTRDKNSIKTDLGVILYEQNGDVHEFVYRNVDNKVNITDEVMKIVGEHVGVNTTFKKLYVYDYHVKTYGVDVDPILPNRPIVFDIDWSIETSENRPVVNDKYKANSIFVESKRRIYEFKGLSNSLYLLKYVSVDSHKDYVYDLLRPSKGHDLDFIKFVQQDATREGLYENIANAGPYSNVATVTGKKVSGDNFYEFKVSPFSENIRNTIDIDTGTGINNPIKYTLIKLGGKTYIYLKSNIQHALSLTFWADTIANKEKKIEMVDFKRLSFNTDYGVRVDITDLVDKNLYEEPILYIAYTYDYFSPDEKIPASKGYVLNLETFELEYKELFYGKDSGVIYSTKAIETAKLDNIIIPEYVSDEASGLVIDINSGSIACKTRPIYGTYTLPSIIQGVEVKHIMEDALSGTNIKTLILPTTLKSIGAFGIAGNIYMETLVLPEGLETLGRSAIRYSLSLKSLHIPSTVKTVGKEAFCESRLLRTITGGSGIEKMDERAFISTAWIENQPSPAMFNGINVEIGNIEKEVVEEQVTEVPSSGMKSASLPKASKVRMEAEKAEYSKSVEIENQSVASGGKVIAYLDYPNEYIQFNNVPKSQGMNIKYSRRKSFRIDNMDVYINDVLVGEIDLPTTDNWSTYIECYIPIDIPHGASVKFVPKGSWGSGAVNFDCIDFYDGN